MKILVATNNKGKLVELGRLFNLAELELVRPADIGLVDFDVEETGTTYLENATLKAVAFAKESGLYAIGDDSGLEVDALDGAPGVYSKRYAGEGANDLDRINLMLSKLEGVPTEKRQAHFTAVLVLAAPDGKVLADVEGQCAGEIIFAPRGNGGFGYDPIFLVHEANGKTMAELTPEEKDSYSHRGNAARKLAPLVRELAQ